MTSLHNLTQEPTTGAARFVAQLPGPLYIPQGGGIGAG